MKKEIREKRNELYQTSLRMRDIANDTKGEKGIEIRKKQDDVYKKWKFYHNIIKKMDEKN